MKNKRNLPYLISTVVSLFLVNSGVLSLLISIDKEVVEKISNKIKSGYVNQVIEIENYYCMKQAVDKGLERYQNR